MKYELQDEFVKKHPQLLQDMWGDPQITCMAFGMEVGEGWAPLLDKLFADIMAANPGEEFKLAQVKEKFAGLRVYADNWPKDEAKYDEIRKLISDAEAESYKICEHCGTKENVSFRKGGWCMTLCDICDTNRKTAPHDSEKHQQDMKESMDKWRARLKMKKESEEQTSGSDCCSS